MCFSCSLRPKTSFYHYYTHGNRGNCGNKLERAKQKAKENLKSVSASSYRSHGMTSRASARPRQLHYTTIWQTILRLTSLSLYFNFNSNLPSAVGKPRTLVHIIWELVTQRIQVLLQAVKELIAQGLRLQSARRQPRLAYHAESIKHAVKCLTVTTPVPSAIVVKS